VLAVAIEFLCNKRRAARVGKRVVSRLGAHILLAAMPTFLACGVLTVFFYQHNLLPYILSIWMLCYGLAICAVGLFSVRNVSYLGAAFVLAGALTMLAPLTIHLYMMALTFGGFHIVYGIVMARRHGW
jgi:predicted phage tail protein